MGIKPPTAKPIFRTSAIFPAFQAPGISTRILFLGYWALKRNIPQITSVVTLRDVEGKVLSRNTTNIVEPRAHRVELADQLTTCGLPADTPFTGSLEIEFFSTVNLVFPYPAVAVNYYGPAFSSVVHTAQRVYNDYDDMRNNSQTDVPESGFNIYSDDNREPFLSMINGPLAVPDNHVEMQFFNSDGESMTHIVNLGEMKPYQTEVIYPARLFDLKKFLKGKVGAGKVKFHVNWIFPRLLVGNIQENPPAVTITHTYYDCTVAQSESDYWLPTHPEWYPAALMVPVSVHADQFTNIYFYPVYSPSKFAIDIEIYNTEGQRLGYKKDVLMINSPFKELKRIDIKALCLKLNIPLQKDLSARILARTLDNSRLPARVKLALDIGDNKVPQMPCNICTNLQPFNPKIETKPTTFRWFPVLTDQPEASLWILNTSPSIAGQKPDEVNLSFYREKDTETITRKATIPPNGFLVIRPLDDPELANFFGNEIGWCTAICSNPYTSTYYFAKNPSGVVGGDHGF